MGVKLRLLLGRYPGIRAFLVPAVLLLLVFVSFYISASLRFNRSASEELGRELGLARASVNDRLRVSVSQLEGETTSIRAALGRNDNEELQEILRNLYASNPELIYAAALDSNGDLITDYPPEYRLLSPVVISPSFDLYVQRNRQPTVGDVLPPSAKARVEVVTIIVPVSRAREPSSPALLANYRLRRLRRWIEPFRIGQTGGFVLIDQNNRIVAASASVKQRAGQKYNSECRDCLVRSAKTLGNWTLIGRLSRSEIRGNVYNVLLLPGLAGALLLIFSAIVGIQVSSLNRLTARQRLEIEEAKRQAEENLKELERGMLPELEVPSEWALSVTHRSATSGADVGGDFFDVLHSDQDELFVIVGDVSGKGIAAAALANTVRTTAQALFEFNQDPGELLTVLNRHMHSRLPKGTFVTMLAARIKLQSVWSAAAGHPPPVVASPLTATKLVEISPELPLGVTGGQEYATAKMPLPDNYQLLLYTDGLTESRNSSGELFGIDRICEHFSRAVTEGQDVTQAKKTITEEAEKWAGGALIDDLSVMVLGRAV